MSAPTDAGRSQPTSLAPCPRTPNCVSSLAEDAVHAVEPLPFSGDSEPVMNRLLALVSAMPGARIQSAQGPYLHATFMSRFFRFVDDLELLADTADSVVHIRSASRKGSWDLGANRHRVERLRARYLAGE